MLKIFGIDLLDDEGQLNGYRELLGLAGHKPFECVGTIDECRTALAQITLRTDWKNDFIISTLAKELDVKKYLDMSAWFKPSQSNIVPTRFRGLRLFQT